MSGVSIALLDATPEPVISVEPWEQFPIYEGFVTPPGRNPP